VVTHRDRQKKDLHTQKVDNSVLHRQSIRENYRFRRLFLKIEKLLAFAVIFLSPQPTSRTDSPPFKSRWERNCFAHRSWASEFFVYSSRFHIWGQIKQLSLDDHSISEILTNLFKPFSRVPHSAAFSMSGYFLSLLFFGECFKIAVLFHVCKNTRPRDFLFEPTQGWLQLFAFPDDHLSHSISSLMNYLLVSYWHSHRQVLRLLGDSCFNLS